MSYYAIRRALREAEIKANLVEVERVKLADASDNVINPATEDTLSAIKAQTDKLSFDDSGNLQVVKAAKQEIAVTFVESSPSASTVYTTDAADVSDADFVCIYVYADQQVKVEIEASLDGTTYYTLAGYVIEEADFEAGKLNNMLISLRVPYLRVKITTGSTAPSVLRAWIVKAY